MDRKAFDELVKCITGGELPRVWSWVVTVFGEMAREPGKEISGTLLGCLADQIAIKPEAIRVALHRLRKDDWIISRRHGRRSVHFLSEKGRTLSSEASPRIYDAVSNPRPAWLVLADPGHPVVTFSVDPVSIGPGMWIAAEKVDDEAVFCARLEPGHELPSWITEKVCPQEMAIESGVFAGRLAELRSLIADPEVLSPLQTVTLRVLIVHGWRRLILKAPTLPDHVFPDGWEGESCRNHVSRLLSLLCRPTQAILENEIGRGETDSDTLPIAGGTRSLSRDGADGHTDREVRTREEAASGGAGSGRHFR